jgi:hypothetical protein
MKTLSSYISRFLLTLALVSTVSVGSAAPRSGGRLVIVRAPNFGWNLGLNLQIDGRSVANLVQGRAYDGFIPAGRHVLTVSAVPFVYSYEPTPMRLNVQTGRMYAFMAMWDDPYHVVLRPTVLTPEQLAQLRH